MPICTAILAAALLSGPTGTPAGTPADPAPLSAKEPMSPGKKIAALAMNHPDEPDVVASKALDILDKGAKVGPFFPSDDEAGNRANGPAANGRSPGGTMAGKQAPGGDASGGRQAGTQPAGPVNGNQANGSANGDQANGAQPGFMFTMPATSKNNSQRSPQDIFLHPTSSKPTYTKMSGNDFARTPSNRKTDDEDAGAWARPLQGWGMQKPGKAKAAKPKAVKPKAAGPKAGPKTPVSDDFWNMPGWD